MTRSIVTVTISPALDVSASVPYVLPDRKLRCTEPIYEPGGGGINVARAIRKLGGDALACFIAGGPTGDKLIALLDAEGVRRQVVSVPGWTRQNLNVSESISGRQFRFCMPGAALADREWTSLLGVLCDLQPVPELVVLSGSLPPGVPADFYARAIDAMRMRGSQVVVDASGEALACCPGHGALVIKTSLRRVRDAHRRPRRGRSTPRGGRRRSGRTRAVRDPRRLARAPRRPVGDAGCSRADLRSGGPGAEHGRRGRQHGRGDRARARRWPASGRCRSLRRGGWLGGCHEAGHRAV